MQSCGRRAAIGGSPIESHQSMRMMHLTGRGAVGEVDSVYAWLRLLAGVLTSTIGGVGMWSIAVVLPTLQADFGVTRADGSFAYTAVMLGAVVGGPVMGWLSDRFGITVPVAIGTAMLALGLALASQAATIWQFTLVHGRPDSAPSCRCSRRRKRRVLPPGGPSRAVFHGSAGIAEMRTMGCGHTCTEKFSVACCLRGGVLERTACS